jgi:hypothetical protein
MSSLQIVLRRLACICVGMSLATSVAVAQDLATIPTRKLAEVVDDAEDDTCDDNDRERLMELLGHDARASIRMRVAESLAIKPLPLSPSVESVLIALTSDESLVVSAVAVSALRSTLLKMDPLERSATVLEWAVADDPMHRLAAAKVIKHPMQILAIHQVFEALSLDERSDVRLVAQDSRNAFYSIGT